MTLCAQSATEFWEKIKKKILEMHLLPDLFHKENVRITRKRNAINKIKSKNYGAGVLRSNIQQNWDTVKIFTNLQNQQFSDYFYFSCKRTRAH